jgi:hypothetical protein
MDGLPPQSTLSAPNSLDAERKLSTAVLVVATLSVLGGGWIILSFMVRTISPAFLLAVVAHCQRSFLRFGPFDIN